MNILLTILEYILGFCLVCFGLFLGVIYWFTEEYDDEHDSPEEHDDPEDPNDNDFTGE